MPILIEPGYNGSVPDPAYVRIDGTDLQISRLSILENKAEGAISICMDGAVLLDTIPYDLFEIEILGAVVPIADYDNLLATLHALHVYNYPGNAVRKLRSAAGNNAQLIKVGSTMLYSVLAFNPKGADAYLKLFDMTGTPDPAIDTPVMTFDTRLLPAAPLTFGTAVHFRSGLAIAVVADGDDGDNTSVSAGDVIVTLIYE